ncbi:MAG: hypothetical protein AAFV53_22680 [Myxococcota bacterium]
MTVLAVVSQPPVNIGLGEAALVIVTTAIVFYIMGPTLWADVQGWLSADRSS